MLIYLFWQRLQLCSNANLDDARSLLGTSWIEKLSESFEFLKRQSSFCFCVSHHPDPEWCFLPSTENLFCTRTKEKVICPGFALFSLAVDENANSTWQAGKGLISRTMKSRRVRKVKHFGIYGSSALAGRHFRVVCHLFVISCPRLRRKDTIVGESNGFTRQSMKAALHKADEFMCSIHFL